MCLTAEALHLKEAQAGIQGVSNRRGGLGRAAVTEHPQRPCLAGENVRLAPRVLGLLSRRGDAGSEQPLARLGAHAAHSNARAGAGK